MRWNQAVLIQPSGRTPAAAIDAMFQRNVERGAINAGLAAGDNVQEILAAIGL